MEHMTGFLEIKHWTVELVGTSFFCQWDWYHFWAIAISCQNAIIILQETIAFDDSENVFCCNWVVILAIALANYGLNNVWLRRWRICWSTPCHGLVSVLKHLTKKVDTQVTYHYQVENNDFLEIVSDNVRAQLNFVSELPYCSPHPHDTGNVYI